MQQFFNISIALVLLCGSCQAQALGWFSRSCRWSEIPASIAPIAAIVFEKIAEVDNSAILKEALNASQENKKKYLIAESITADYGMVRYFLFAEARLFYYAAEAKDGVRYPAAWQEAKRYPGSNWTARTLPTELTADTRLQIFYANRQLLYSARSGSPQIIEKAGWSIPDAPQFRVLGTHSYYDPSAGALVNLGQSTATDCNFSQWGVETLGQYR